MLGERSQTQKVKEYTDWFSVCDSLEKASPQGQKSDPGVGGRDWPQSAMKKLLGVMGIFYIIVVVVIIGLYMFVRTLLTIKLNVVNFTVYKANLKTWPLNTLEKKKKNLLIADAEENVSSVSATVSLHLEVKHFAFQLFPSFACLLITPLGRPLFLTALAELPQQRFCFQALLPSFQYRRRQNFSARKILREFGWQTRDFTNKSFREVILSNKSQFVMHILRTVFNLVLTVIKYS